MSLLLLTLIPLFLFNWAASAQAAELVPRSFPSGGTICYYGCPPTHDGHRLKHSAAAGGNTFTCSYCESPSQVVCTYSGTSGSVLSGPCSSPAPIVYCGSQPQQGMFKRDGRRSRQLTRAEEIIRERQYKPKAGRE